MVDTKEIWKEVTINSNYLVSNFGRVKSKERYVPCKTGYRLKKEHILTQTDNHGYLHVGFNVNGKLVNPLVHKLVMIAFVGEKPYPEWEIDHINGDTHDNRLENLQYVSSSENTKRAYSLGLQSRETLSRVRPTRKITPEQAILLKRRFIEEGRNSGKKNGDFFRKIAEEYGYSTPNAARCALKIYNKFFGEDIVQTTKQSPVDVTTLDFSNCKTMKEKFKIIACAFNITVSAVDTKYYKYKMSLEQIVAHYNRTLCNENYSGIGESK